MQSSPMLADCRECLIMQRPGISHWRLGKNPCQISIPGISLGEDGTCCPRQNLVNIPEALHWCTPGGWYMPLQWHFQFEHWSQLVHPVIQNKINCPKFHDIDGQYSLLRWPWTAATFKPDPQLERLSVVIIFHITGWKNFHFSRFE